VKISKRQLKQIIREEYTRLKSRGLIREVRMEDSGFQIGDRVKYPGYGAVGDGIIIDMKQDGVNHHGRPDSSSIANPRTLLVVEWEDGKVTTIPSTRLMHFDEPYPRQ